jgi:hypothetical protein
LRKWAMEFHRHASAAGQFEGYADLCHPGESSRPNWY